MSKGWQEEAQVIWLDGEGNLLSAGPTETVRGSDGLYTVSSRVTVEKRHNNSFTCRVQQNHPSQTREAQIYIAGKLFVFDMIKILKSWGQTLSCHSLFVCLFVFSFQMISLTSDPVLLLPHLVWLLVWLFASWLFLVDSLCGTTVSQKCISVWLRYSHWFYGK